MILLLSFAFLLTSSEAQNVQPAPLVMLTDPKARCLDGTLGGFYALRSTTPRGATRYVIHLQGGGECDTKSACQNETKSTLGSSKYFPNTTYLGFLGRSLPSENPDFYDANRVMIAYCSGDLWSGQVEVPSSATWGLYFSGRFIVQATLKALEETYGLLNATDIVISGDSAGGIGTWHHLDWLALQYPKARVVGSPFAGFYFTANTPYNGPDHTASILANFSSEGLQKAYLLWNSFVDQSCALALAKTPWLCLLSNNSFPYVSSGAFVSEAQTDLVVLQYHDWVPAAPLLCNAPEKAYVTAWSLQMRTALAPLMDPSNGNNGVFNPACYIHTEFYPQSPVIRGVTYVTAFGNWYFKRTGPEGFKMMDACGDIFCNPTCTKPCP